MNEGAGEYIRREWLYEEQVVLDDSRDHCTTHSIVQGIV